MSVSVTDSAASHIKKYADAPCLRIEVTSSGCSGFTYKADIISRIEDSDHVYTSNGVTIVVSQHSIPYIDGMLIDYTTDGINEGFKYINPNVDNTCGCGTSFTTGEKK